MMQSSLRNKLFLLAFSILLLQPIAHSLAADTLFGPTGATVGAAVEYASDPIDASAYENLRLNFDYVAETLDTGDSFTYGWRSAGVDTDLGTFNGLPDGLAAVPGDETDTIVKNLPDASTVSDLVVYVKVTANSTISNDSVTISNLSITGDLVTIDPDTDSDGVIDELDNCVNTPNTDQSDADTDGIGDACDTDADNDGVSDEVDNCSEVPNADQIDLDADEIGDACDDDVDVSSDEDEDGVDDAIDLCFSTEMDTFSDWGRSQGRYGWDGNEWIATDTKSTKFIPDMAYTYGCSGTQILSELAQIFDEDYSGHAKHGLSRGLLQFWHEQNF